MLWGIVIRQNKFILTQTQKDYPKSMMNRENGIWSHLRKQMFNSGL